MGKFNSSKTRVRPVFDALLSNDMTGRTWLPALLTLPTGGTTANFMGLDFNLGGHAWEGNTAEKPLPPPVSLLRWLVSNLREPINPNVWNTSTDTQKRRRQLIARDPETIAEALAALDHPIKGPPWYVLEGDSSPDVYLTTANIIIVIEGKRTEGKPTRSTAWMPGRHQMWRHIDCAWEHRGKKRVYGLMIVETSDEARSFAAETISASAIRGSLPHRSEAEVAEIAACFLGTTTWEAICDRCGVPWNEIKTRVV